MQLFIKTLTGKTIVVEVESSDSIKEVKKKIHEKENIPWKIIGLVRFGQLCQDHRPLSEYSPEKEVPFHLIIKLASQSDWPAAKDPFPIQASSCDWHEASGVAPGSLERLYAELMKVQRSSTQSYYVVPNGMPENFRMWAWSVAVKAPAGSPYDGTFLLFQVTFPPNYPLERFSSVCSFFFLIFYSIHRSNLLTSPFA